ncbi:DUF3618 domain-containing protein [Streptomyces sp. XM4193]|uniref:DUF3618 domain-containing protein n=1 Tax=Streptomyces sp. XM4193 TaxID=2929782 RepID=UPI001FF72CC7|nr:DUF3618 domain-containing protein [Streptomyces sp. XM4193]MCK1798510.1 DUF3618 domain-containing protein [Streptomyces sp. XM4193]
MAQAKAPGDIEAQIARSRQRLAVTLDEIAVRVHPSTILGDVKDRVSDSVDRTVGQACVRVNGLVDRARSQVVAPDGSPRMERIVPAAVVTVAVVGAVVVSRRKRR